MSRYGFGFRVGLGCRTSTQLPWEDPFTRTGADVTQKLIKH